MESYSALAASYDRLTNDVSYPDILKFHERIFAQYQKKPESVLDLACGTGSLSVLYAEKGCRVLGVDGSEEMLTEAYRKLDTFGENVERPYFICQKMQSLRLPYTVDAVVSCLDSMNYLTKPEDLKKTFQRVLKALEPGGVFVFDMNTPAKFHALDGQLFLDEDDNVFCLWRAELSEKTNIMTYGIDLFKRTGKLWKRSREEHREYCYEPHDVELWLAEAGFRNIKVYGDRRLEAPSEGEQRVFFACCKE